MIMRWIATKESNERSGDERGIKTVWIKEREAGKRGKDEGAGSRNTQISFI